MKNISLQLDKRAEDSIHELMSFYNVKNSVSMIIKSLEVMKIISCVNKNGAELYVKKGNKEYPLVIN